MSEDTLQISDAARERIDRLGLNFLAEVLDLEVRARPDNAAALVTLGMVLTRLGRYREGLAVDRRLVALAPEDPTCRYNLACSLALLGETQSAIDALEESVRLGFDDPKHLAGDEDLASLRGEARFQSIVEALEQTRS